MSHLIPVSKGADYLEVHPGALAEHKKLGWVQCEKQSKPKAASDSDDGRLPDAEQRKLLIDMLTERGIEFSEDMGTDELRALTITPNPDGLDDLDVDQLRALAAERGVAVHARAGADKIRAALRAAGDVQ
ncbi:MAG: hypothetical protein WBA82_08030 [Castellaniella sp.]|uniref:hypothetical protein n=1 Tax=Castellaniella sp. TaxID=1955812 RepID=UPI003C76F1E6